MSRSTVSKSRTDKNKDRDTKGTTSTSVPQTNTDVIPGRFTESDWNAIVEKEDRGEFVTGVIAEIVDSAINIIHDNYIQKQLYPYVTEYSRQLFLSIIEWQFQARDGGERNLAEDKTWVEEEEPLPSTPDAWAQGSIPHRLLPPVSAALSEHDTEVTSVSRISNLEPVLEDPSSTVNDSVVDEAETERSFENERERTLEEVGPEMELGEENNNWTDVIKQQEKDTPIKKTKKAKYKPHRGPLKSAGVRNMNQTLEDTEKELEAEMRLTEGLVLKSALDYMPSSCHNILKVQAGRPPGSKEVTYDDRGNVVAVVKLDPEKLPSHRVRTKFTVVDPAVEAAQARLQAMRTGRNYRANQTAIKQNNPEGGTTKMKTLTADTNCIGSSSKTKQGEEEQKTPLPPPLIESIEASPGVTVREGHRFKQGPKVTLRNLEIPSFGKVRSLQPLKILDRRGAPLSVGDIISSSLVKPLTVNDPIPPIISRHTP